MPLLFKKICEEDYEPLPDSISDDIRALVSMMLQKDPDRRASLLEIANVSAVKSRVVKFSIKAAEMIDSLSKEHR